MRGVRNIRSELGIPPNATVSVHVAADGRGDEVSAFEPYMKALAKVGTVELARRRRATGGEPSALVEGFGEIFVPLRGVVDPHDVRKRLEKDLGKVEKELSGVEAKLGTARLRRQRARRHRGEGAAEGDARCVSGRQTLQRHLGGAARGTLGKCQTGNGKLEMSNRRFTEGVRLHWPV